MQLKTRINVGACNDLEICDVGGLELSLILVTC